LAVKPFYRTGCHYRSSVHREYHPQMWALVVSQFQEIFLSVSLDSQQPDKHIAVNRQRPYALCCGKKQAVWAFATCRVPNPTDDRRFNSDFT
jgi:hypothetical protein